MCLVKVAVPPGLQPLDLGAGEEVTQFPQCQPHSLSTQLWARLQATPRSALLVLAATEDPMSQSMSCCPGAAK